MDLKFEAIEAEKEALVQDLNIQAFFHKLDQIRELGLEGFQARLEDLLGRMLSAAQPHQKYVFFEALLNGISNTQWDSFFTDFFDNQAKELLNKSTYRQRVETIIKKWNTTIRLGFNFPGWIDVKTQRVQHLEQLNEALDSPTFKLEDRAPVNVYEDGSLKKAVDLVVTTGMRRIFGWNGFLDDLQQLQTDHQNNVVALNQSAFFNSKQPQSSLVKALVLRLNNLESRMNEERQSYYSNRLDLLTHIGNLQAQVDRLQGSEALKDTLQGQVVPRLNKKNSMLSQQNAKLAPALETALHEIAQLKANQHSLKAELKLEKTARIAAEKDLVEERQLRELAEAQYNELAQDDADTNSPNSSTPSSYSNSPMHFAGKFAPRASVKGIFDRNVAAQPANTVYVK